MFLLNSKKESGRTRGAGRRAEKSELQRERGDESAPTADRQEEKKEPCDNVTPMDMNMTMNSVARFKSNSEVLSLMFTTQSQKGLEATLALSIIPHARRHTCTRTPANETQRCNFY